MLASNKKVITPEQLEFAQSSKNLIMKRLFIFPFISQEKRTKIVNDYLNGLSDLILAQNLNVCLLQIAMSKSECKKYENTKKQVESISVRLPRLSKYRGRLTEYVREKRNKYGLIV